MVYKIFKRAAWLMITAVPVIIYNPLAWAEIPSLRNPNIQALGKQVHVLVGDMALPNQHNNGFICNSIFIITQTGVVVVDPGGSRQVGEMILREIRKRTDKPVSHVFNTHHHADHWMGNHAFAGLQPRPVFIGHTYMRDQALEIGERWLEIIANLTEGANKGTRVVVPDRVVKGDEIFDIGGVHMQLLHYGHAHTRGDIAIYLPQLKILLAGDILFYKRTPGFQDASPLGNLAALEAMHKLDVKHVVPGHGPVTDKSGIKYMIDYVHLLHDEVNKYFEAGLQDFEMKDRINVGDYRNMSGFKDRFGINVNRMYLQVEKNSF
jgi:glyoxylase-like metal-dependent hydrolase (beta-lactamase superfamily II)